MDRQRELKIFKDLISMNTVAKNEGRVAHYLSRLFDKYGVKNKIIPQFPDRDNLVAEIGDGHGKKLGFAGHEDTVDIGDLKKWHTDPFKVTIKGHFVYGRGVTDMKSSLSAMAIALIDLSKQHLNGTLRFIATISEELTQGGANKLSKLGYVDDLDSIVIGESTGVNSNELSSYFGSGGTQTDPKVLAKLENKAKHDTFEQHFVVNAHKGALIYKVSSKGKTAHSSTPRMGINAIDNLINYRIAEGKMFKSFTDKDDELGPTIYTPDVFHGGKQVNSIPDYAYEEVMVRTIPEVPNNTLIDHIKKLIHKFNQKRGYDLSLEVKFSGNPVKTPANSKIIKTFQKDAGVMNEPMNLPNMTISMGTDGSQYHQRTPKTNIAIIGVGNESAHQINEFANLDAYFNIIKLYEKVAKDYLNN